MESKAPVRFVVGKDGVYQLVENRLGVFCLKTQNVEGLEDIGQGLIMKLPRVPVHLFHQTIAFFRAVMKKLDNAEAIVHIYWSTEKKEYYIHIPEQEVSGAICEYEHDNEREMRDVLVMHIHSHNTMGANFSTIDDKDDTKPIIYGVVGKLNTMTPEYSFRIGVGGLRCNIDPKLIFDGAATDFPEDWLEHVTRKVYKYDKYSGGNWYDKRDGGSSQQPLLPAVGGSTVAEAITPVHSGRKKDRKNKQVDSIHPGRQNKPVSVSLKPLENRRKVYLHVSRLLEEGYSEQVFAAIADHDSGLKIDDK
jgi:PRTRC genetic system protein A